VLANQRVERVGLPRCADYVLNSLSSLSELNLCVRLRKLHVHLLNLNFAQKIFRLEIFRLDELGDLVLVFVLSEVVCLKRGIFARLGEILK